ncbi:MFS transporter [Bacillaceae bacterium W0354]
MVYERFRFSILVTIVGISGFSQGMLLPLIAIIFEHQGVSSSLNGFHATALYIGILIISPFLEPPLRKFGYKPIILFGGLIVILSLFSFTLWESLWFWFILRLLIGVGDNILHFGTQTWITTSTPEHKRGRSIAIYGLSFALGFTTGPLMVRLLVIDQALPFIISSVLCLIVWILMFFVRNEFPQHEDDVHLATNNSLSRFIKATKIAWIAFLAPFAYGFLEATLNGNFPVYGMRLGHHVEMLSLIIPCFAAASIISQIPLGILSDKFGRPKVLVIVLSGGVGAFLLAAIFEHSVVWLFITFSLAGLLVGSLFSLGMSYMADLLPKSLLPAGNILCGAAFSIGSISGPIIGGSIIEYFPNVSFFTTITIFLSIVLVTILISQKRSYAIN